MFKLQIPISESMPGSVTRKNRRSRTFEVKRLFVKLHGFPTQKKPIRTSKRNYMLVYHLSPNRKETRPNQKKRAISINILHIRMKYIVITPFVYHPVSTCRPTWRAGDAAGAASNLARFPCVLRVVSRGFQECRQRHT